MKKLMTIFAAALFVVSLSSCGGPDACSCVSDLKALGEKSTKEGADKEAIAKEITELNKKCDDAAGEDAEAWAKALKECE
jgi:hypothetical protein